MSGGGGLESNGLSGGANAAPRRRGIPGRVIAVAAVAVLAVAVVAIVMGVVLVSRDSGPTATYDAGTEQRFLDSCTADGGDPVRPACQCLYNEIVAAIPYARFEELSEQLVAASTAGEPFVLPSEIQALVPACQIPA